MPPVAAILSRDIRSGKTNGEAFARFLRFTGLVPMGLLRFDGTEVCCKVRRDAGKKEIDLARSEGTTFPEKKGIYAT